MDLTPLSKAEELRAIASAFRTLPNEEAAEVYRFNMAGKYLRRALNVGAFAGPQWTRFRMDAEHWFQTGLPFVMASDWFKDNARDLNLEVEPDRTNGDLEYWCHYVADLIEQEATAVEHAHHTTLEAAARLPKNRWKAFHHWWQHNTFATAAVIIVLIISAIGGLFSFAREVLGLFAR